ncbi:hypothetical protein EQU50_03845 [Candidatus Finniella inopinata]|uniref:Antitoxin n=1 Tax=Candidatus Finniella inopinata TaxID=1696036 RepID=A0A4Q7DJ70_9PROT|nr:type II toxin-antitoxin system Phd/YefM family antitoxin [Candidatus Finniella inopinata]RZI46074.1 hypothetical protein EQU50_03845 [Candidatus Finniella inopinata]
MKNLILTHLSATITELKKNPMATFKAAGGEPIAILDRNEPVFYCVPAKTFEGMIEALDDLYLAKIAQERQGEEEIEVSLSDLCLEDLERREDRALTTFAESRDVENIKTVKHDDVWEVSHYHY